MTMAWPGLWPMVRRKAVPGRYAALRCLWHDIPDHRRATGHTGVKRRWILGEKRERARQERAAAKARPGYKPRNS
eukprot:2014230-Prymnesium_polylepis.1